MTDFALPLGFASNRYKEGNKEFSTVPLSLVIIQDKAVS
jgi:hypothetical protein